MSEVVMRAWMVVVGMVLGCTPAQRRDSGVSEADASVMDEHDGCPAELPLVSDWGEGVPPRTVAVGTTVLLNFSPINFEERCVVVDTAGPGGPFVVTVTSPSVEFVAASAGPYSVTIHHWTRIGRSYGLSVEAQTPPAILRPCVVLPRSCTRVFDGQSHVTCDDTLYSLAGDPLRTLDGGAWFGSGDALFAWEDGRVRRISITDAGVEEVASSPSLLPHLWAFGADRLAIGTGDGGVLFDVSAQGLAPIADLALAPEPGALAFSSSAALMTASDDVVDFACLVGGGCARDPFAPNASPRLAAANEQGVYVLVQHTLFGNGDPVLFTPAGDGGFTNSYWSSASGDKLTVRPGAQVPRRAHLSTIWGMSVEGVAGVMNLANAERWSSTDGVVWASSATETAIWCVPR